MFSVFKLHMTGADLGGGRHFPVLPETYQCVVTHVEHSTRTALLRLEGNDMSNYCLKHSAGSHRATASSRRATRLNPASSSDHAVLSLLAAFPGPCFPGSMLVRWTRISPPIQALFVSRYTANQMVNGSRATSFGSN